MPTRGPRQEPNAATRPVYLVHLVDEFLALIEEHRGQMPKPERALAAQLARDLDDYRVRARRVHRGSEVA